jgi:hypothetical protein
MTLAGRLNDPVEAQRHMRGAWTAAEEFPRDIRVHRELFGVANTGTHVLATEGSLGRPRQVIRIADELSRNDTRLPATRIVPSLIYLVLQS